jgi:eukaryotic-like serine/threonine-protein kinase
VEDETENPRAMALNPADIAIVSRLLDDGLAVPQAERAAWLAGLPLEHQRHAGSLRAMLEQADGMPSDPMLEALPTIALDESVARAQERVGPYRLLREIGHGGMGSVWLAERADGAFKRQVALKLPRLAWGAGLADRMTREREIGMLLEHPNIARLYDAGVDEHGRPYLALEFVDGQPIDVWCDTQGLNVRERLRLFVQVIQAVSYAHGRLVVHRDLKPSNVLVSSDGQVHLLDFGIAKLLVDDSTSGSDLTQDRDALMTPQYASPEQVSGHVITVASDVYSLGALLYELLTGQFPYVLKRNTVGEMEEAILHGEPARASSRAATPARARELRGELDAILARSLKRDPAQQYATAEAMGADIERYLGGDIVLARQDSFAYRAGKTLRRYALPIATSALVLTAVLVGAAVALVQARRANAEAERARVVKEFVVDIFNTKGGPDGSLGEMPGHALLERSAALIATKFADQPLLQAELYSTVSDMFFSIANNDQAVSYAEQQVLALKRGRADPLDIARALLRSHEFLIPAGAKGIAEAKAREALALSGSDAALTARAHAALANALMFINKDLPAAKAEVDAAQKALARGGTSEMDRAWVNFAHANWLAFSKQTNEARLKFDQTIAGALAGEGPLSRLAVYARLAAAQALIFGDQDQLGKDYLDAALKTMRLTGGVNDANAALWEFRGASWMYSGDSLPFSEVSAAFDRNMASLQAQKWRSPAKYIDTVEFQFGIALLRWGDIDRARLLIVKDRPPSDDPSTVTQWLKLNGRAAALMPSDRSNEVPALVRQMLALQESWRSPHDVGKTYNLLVLSLVYARRHAEAEQALAEQALAEHKALPDAPVEATPSAATGEAPPTPHLLLALETGRDADVVAMTAGLKPKPGIHADETAWLARATALCATGQPAEATRLFDEWLPRVAHDRYEANPHVAYWRAKMGLCALANGQRQRAQDASALATAALMQQSGVNAHFRAPIEELQRRLRR